jgi:CubicO group peptidase (beta-lactamase class C family)
VTKTTRFSDAEAVLVRHVDARTTPAAAAAVVHSDQVTWTCAVGSHTYDEGALPTRVDDLFDLASVTKVVATATLCAMLVDDGRLDIDQPVGKSIPEFAGEGKGAITPRHLLSHSSGMPAHVHLYDAMRDRREIVEAAIVLELDYAPGSASVYSDMGYIVLGELIERLCGETLDELFRERITGLMKLAETMFHPEVGQERIVPTEYDRTMRMCLVHGEVHDENAWAMGGVAPHAGLFSNVEDLGRCVRMWLRKGQLDGRRVLSEAVVDLFTQRNERVSDSTWALGWDTVSQGSTSGRTFSERSYGILGFTGTSLWVDPERDLGVVLLTNRVHPTRDSEGIKRLRPEFHDAVSEGM